MSDQQLSMLSQDAEKKRETTIGTNTQDRYFMQERIKAVLGMYTTRDGVQLAVEAFRDAGFENCDISVVLPENMPVEELGRASRKSGSASCDDVEIAGGSAAKKVDSPRAAAVLERQEDTLLIVGPLAQRLDGNARECAPEDLEATLLLLGIPERDTGGYADKVLRGRALLSIHCADADKAMAARRLHGDLGGMDVFTARHADPMIKKLYRSMAFSSGR